MSRLIWDSDAIDAVADYIHNVDKVYSEGKLSADDCKDAAKSVLDELPSAQPEIIRCKDCKHKPHASDKYDYDNGDCGFEIIFPDYRCPCRCEDEYYNRIPDNDWYCGNAERRTDE